MFIKKDTFVFYLAIIIVLFLNLKSRVQAQALEMVYSTYLGGIPNNPHGKSHGIAVDMQGNVHVTGTMQSEDLPLTPDAFQEQYTGIFISKLNPDGDSLIFSSYIGEPGGVNWSQGVAVDKDGNIYVVGTTTNDNFPTTAGAYDSTYNGSSSSTDGDVFVMKLNPEESEIIYSTFIGGSGVEIAGAITVDSYGCAYIVGNTSSANFPVTPGSYDTAYNGGENDGRDDLFVAKLNPEGSDLVYCTYIGGSNTETYLANIAIDDSGCVYIAANTSSTDFPLTENAYDTSYNGGSTDGIFVILSADGSELKYSSYIGGNDRDNITSFDINPEGGILLAGSTMSTDFPTTEDAYSQINKGQYDVYFMDFSPQLNQLNYSTLIGGSLSETGQAFFHQSGLILINGQTRSPEFPFTEKLSDVIYNGESDLFIAVFDPNDKKIKLNTAFGGSGNEWCTMLVKDDYLYLTGQTTSQDFPTTSGAFDTINNGGSSKGNIYITKLLFDTTKTNTGYSKPTIFDTFKSYPNPFSSATTVQYSLTKPLSVKLSIYNNLGQRIKTLVNSYQNAGEYSTVWDGTNFRGTVVNSGIYFYELATSEYKVIKKILLIQ